MERIAAIRIVNCPAGEQDVLLGLQGRLLLREGGGSCERIPIKSL